VKPRLDRFIITKLGKSAFPSLSDIDLIYHEGCKIAESRAWLIGNGENGALNYKLRIVEEGQSQKLKIEKGYPNYLGNMGNTVDNKGFVIGDQIIVNFLINNLNLKDVINDEFSRFLSINNFGNRQSKGFGGFSISSMSESNFESFLQESFQTVYKLKWKNNVVNLLEDHKFLFRKIQDEYKLIKAGDSRNKKESKLRLYINRLSPPLEWEKPVLQSDISEISKKKMNIDWSNKNFHYVRALLGLADHFEYLQLKITVHFKPEDENFERFTSPLIFKVFNNCLYLITSINNNLNQIRGKVINISYKRDGVKFPGKDRILNIPDIDFDLVDFLNQALKNTNWKKL